MNQVARNLTDSAAGPLRAKAYLIHDRDPLFAEQFIETLAGAGVKAVRLPARSPRPEAHIPGVKAAPFGQVTVHGQACSGAIRRMIALNRSPV